MNELYAFVTDITIEGDGDFEDLQMDFAEAREFIGLDPTASISKGFPIEKDKLGSPVLVIHNVTEGQAKEVYEFLMGPWSPSNHSTEQQQEEAIE